MGRDPGAVPRRVFLEQGVWASAMAASAFAVEAASAGHARAAADAGPQQAPAEGALLKAAGVPLREKFFGCIAGCHIGSAMGAPVEGWPWERIEREHGMLDRLVPYEHYGNKWVREPGTTEDGVERQKLMITAILEKQDRVTAEDVRRIWVRDIKPEAPGNVSEPFEGMLLAMAKTAIPAADIGKYCDYAGLVSMARSCHPLGLINAGDIDGALRDVRDVGQLYQTANSRGIRWAEVTVVGIAAATRPGATTQSVLRAIADHCDKGVVQEVERGLRLTADCKDVREMRTKFDAVYSGRGMAYAQSYANEVVTKGVCIFKMTGGNAWQSMKAAVNMGRDTDCLASVAAGLSGALSGGGSIPPEIVKQVDYATTLNKFTNSKRTLRETADGLYHAFQARLKRLRTYITEMETA
jgi:ADP-ribosylglycohydrolase